MFILIIIKLIILLQSIKISESYQCEEHSKIPEIQIKNALFCDAYDKYERPTAKNGTVVTIRLYIKRFDYMEMAGDITVHSWLRMKWVDDRLKWNPKDHDGVDQVIIDSDDIWMPNLALYNSKETQFGDMCSETPCSVYSNGRVACIPPCSHTGECKTNYQNWPFDIQNCSLHFGAWMHRGNEITYKEERTTLDYSSLTHNEWKITSVKVTNKDGKYACCPNSTFPSIFYTLIVERHANSDKALIVTPAIILTILNLMVLWFNPNSLERIILLIVSCFSHLFFVQDLTWVVPKNGESIPVIVIYFRDSMIFSMVILCETMLMRGLLLCRTSSPDWLKSTAQKLRGYTVGQLMFENPYIINSKQTSDELNTDDAANLVEGQTNSINGNENQTERDIWFIVVKTIDTLLFLILFLCYLIMLIGWLPSSSSNEIDKNSVDITNSTA